jgi:hypothetical protein
MRSKAHLSLQREGNEVPLVCPSTLGGIQMLKTGIEVMTVRSCRAMGNTWKPTCQMRLGVLSFLKLQLWWNLPFSGQLWF